MRRELAATQRWMQSAIVAEEPVSVRQIRNRILPSATLAPEERLDIYRGMYEARLIDALGNDFPALKVYLGEEMFAELAAMYVRSNPSRTYTLNRFGDRLPEFLKELTGLPKPGFVRELARYELAQTIVFDAEETPPLTPDQIAAVRPDAWAAAKLKPIAAFHLVPLRYNTHAYAKAVRQESRRPSVVRRDNFVLIHRRNYGVNVLELSKSAFQVLRLLAAGKPLGTALRTARAPQRSIANWFRTWTEAGLFQSVEI